MMLIKPETVDIVVEGMRYGRTIKSFTAQIIVDIKRERRLI